MNAVAHRVWHILHAWKGRLFERTAQGCPPTASPELRMKQDSDLNHCSDDQSGLSTNTAVVTRDTPGRRISARTT